MGDRVRLDKWLWAARFYKTRSAATEAVAGGKIEVNDDPAKPARPVTIGDRIRVRQPPFEYRIEVTGLAERRGSAEQAATLYAESPESAAAREQLRDQLRMAPAFSFDSGRPTKKGRREWDKLRNR